jgi:dihydroxy-acid dehydratase
MSQEGIRRARGELFEDEGPDGLIARGFLRGSGRTGTMVRRRPVIGIANTWSELNPCNGGLRDLAEHVKRGVLAAGGTAVEFPTISIAEAYVRPSSLYLRNLLAMDTEEMITASPIDGVVVLGGCDKTIPAMLMGAASANKPTLALAAGPRPLSRWEGKPMTVEQLWPLIDQRRAGQMCDGQWTTLEESLSCGVGTCNVMGTAITMAVVAEVLGMALPGSTLPSATSSRRAQLGEETGRRIVERTRSGIKPADLISERSLHNAFRAICAVGGSTNAVIHLAAIAGRVGVELDTEQLRELSASTPLVADVRPSGSGYLHELDEDGGVPAIMQRLASLCDMDAPSGNDRPWRDDIEPGSGANGRIRTLEEPAGPPGPIAVLTGSLAPDGAILKASAATEALLRHRGRAIVFDGVDDLRARIDDPDLGADASSVLVLRGVGPLGGPGMPEVGHVPIPAGLFAQGVTDMVRISDARMSGTASGTVVLHVAPEAAVGGPLAFVRDGDLIELDVPAGRLDLVVDPAELERRTAGFDPPHPHTRGYERIYRDHVLQAPDGCDFDFLRAQASTWAPS